MKTIKELEIRTELIGKVWEDKNIIELNFEKEPDRKIDRQRIYLGRTDEYNENYDKDPKIDMEYDRDWHFRYYTYKETVLDDGMEKFTAYIDSVNEDMKKLKKAGYIILNENELKEVVKANAVWRRAVKKKEKDLSDEALILMNKAVLPVIRQIKEYSNTKNYLDEALPGDLNRIVDRLNMLSEDLGKVTEKDVDRWLKKEMKMDMEQLKRLSGERYDAMAY